MYNVKIADYHDEDGDDGYDIDAFDAKAAAIEAARRYDHNGDYYLANGDEATAIVKNISTGKTAEFVLSAEPSIHYRAIKKD